MGQWQERPSVALERALSVRGCGGAGWGQCSKVIHLDGQTAEGWHRAGLTACTSSASLPGACGSP